MSRPLPPGGLWAGDPATSKAYAAERRLADLGLWSDVNGVCRYTAADGNAYAVGSLYCPISAPPITISSTTGQPVTGVGCPVVPGITYHFEGIIRLKQGGTANIADSVGVSLSNAATGTWFISQSDGTTQRFLNAQSMNAFFATGGATPANAENCLEIWGNCTTSANDTLQITAKISTVNFSVLAGTYIIVSPM